MDASYNAFVELGEMLDVVNGVGHIITGFLVVFTVVGIVFLIPIGAYRYSVNYLLESSRRQNDGTITIVYVKASILTIFIFLFCLQIIHVSFVEVFQVYDTVGDVIFEIFMLSKLQTT